MELKNKAFAASTPQFVVYYMQAVLHSTVFLHLWLLLLLCLLLLVLMVLLLLLLLLRLLFLFETDILPSSSSSLELRLVVTNLIKHLRYNVRKIN